MNIDRFDENDLRESPRHYLRPYLILIFWVVALLLWALLTPVDPLKSKNLTSIRQGSGTGNGGDGPGSGEKGDGRGQGGAGNSPHQAAEGTGQSGPTVSAHSTGARGQSSETASASPSPVPAPEAPPVSLSEALKRQPQTGPSAPQVGSKGGDVSGRKGFYGAEVSEKERSLFIVDVSGSMGSMSREIPGKTSSQVLRMELKKALFGGQAPTEKTYQRRGGFIIIAFDNSTNVFPADGICTYRKRKNIAEANDFIDNKLHPSGGTVMQPAWALAVKLVDKYNIDTVYFLTDGLDSQGFSDSVLLPMLKKCRNRRLKVNCIALRIDQEFMKKIAAATKGQYIYIP